jgi:TonB family protein
MKIMKNKIFFITILNLLFCFFCFGQKIKERCLEGNCRNKTGKYIYSDSSVYTGEFYKRLKTGQGKLSFKNKNTYEGQWLNDKLNGYGVFMDAAGNKYVGNWMNNKRHGQGSNIDSLKNKYEGSWIEDKKNGFGKYTDFEGNIYEGLWSNDKQNGLGKQMDANGNIYSGSWNDGTLLGNVKIQFKNNDVYDGEYINGLNGKGTLTYSDGSIYKGNWSNNMRFSSGEMIFSFGITYKGNWSNNEVDGTGEFYETTTQKLLASGNWKTEKTKDGDLKFINNNGFMVCIYKNKDLYYGSTKNMIPNGAGVIHYANGELFEGYFLDGLFSGVGLYKYKESIEYIGDWKKGKKDGVGTLVQKDKSEQKGYWMNDVFYGSNNPFQIETKVIDGYNAVKIGNQYWMSKNLNLDSFRNGDAIKEARTEEEWNLALQRKQPAWHYAMNNSDYDTIFGKLYNIYSVIDSRGLAPKGWEIPNDSNWLELIEDLGGAEKAGQKIKSTTGWSSSEEVRILGTGNGTNESGFNGFPLGTCDFDRCWECGKNRTEEYLPGYNHTTTSAQWWSSSEGKWGISNNCFFLGYGPDQERGVYTYIYEAVNYRGYSIRCIKSLNNLIVQKEETTIQTKQKKNSALMNDDESKESDSQILSKEKSDSKKINVIGGFEFSTKDLKVFTFRNGEPIRKSNSKEDWLFACRNEIPSYVEKRTPDGRNVIYYNWYCIKDKRGLAPEGWHIPNSSEWNHFIDALGYENAGKMMKSSIGWDVWEETVLCSNCKNAIWTRSLDKHNGPCGKVKRNGNGTNSSKFNAQPNGYVYYWGVINPGSYLNYWVMDIAPTSLEFTSHSNKAEFRLNENKEIGYNVRCFKDDEQLLNQGDSNLKFEIEKDQNGNEFKLTKIGNQFWMAQNLNVDKFRNGEPIKHAKTNEEWIKAGENRIAAWCYYDNDPTNGIKYGKLYNSYALSDQRGLAPVGWHIPSDDEWTEMITFLGGFSDNSGKSMKLNKGWFNQGNGTNSSGFSGAPGGARGGNGVFYNGYEVGSWWSAPKYWNYGAEIFEMSSYLDRIKALKFLNFGYGFSIRCVKDQINEQVQNESSITQNDLKKLENKIPISSQIEESTENQVIEEPQFAGGYAGLMKYIQNNLNYPDNDLTNEIQGKVILVFYVEPDGRISDINLVKGVSETMNAEALRLVKSMPNWIPGTINGKKSKLKFTLPINFQLN